jgi:hypothetical protein
VKLYLKNPNCFFLLVVLGFELRALHLLGRYSTTQVTHSLSRFYFDYFWVRVSYFWRGRFCFLPTTLNYKISTSSQCFAWQPVWCWDPELRLDSTIKEYILSVDYCKLLWILYFGDRDGRTGSLWICHTFCFIVVIFFIKDLLSSQMCACVWILFRLLLCIPDAEVIWYWLFQ